MPIREICLTEKGNDASVKVCAGGALSSKCTFESTCNERLSIIKETDKWSETGSHPRTA